MVHPPTHTHSHALTFDRTRLSIAEFISFRISPVIVLLYLTFSAFSTPSLPLTSTSVHRFLSLPPSSKKRLPSVERPLHPPTITDPRRSSSKGEEESALSFLSLPLPILFPFSLPRGCTDSCEIKPRAMTPPRLSGDCILA